jgi:dihydrofolate reductase
VPAGAPDEALARIMNGMTKHVASRSRRPLAWQSSTLLDGDVAGSVRELKRRGGKNLLVVGSGELVQTLAAADLVDEYRLSVCPLVLGAGKRLFRDGLGKQEVTLASTKTNSKGVLFLDYARRGGER